ncbi:MAG: F0F1 ATP synthase subunit delta [Bacillota bacterium]|nr:F0F1 ATP synthase subunit delta [Bacillota bacterium]
MLEYLSRRYALALYRVGEEKSKVEEYLNDLKQISDLITNNSELLDAIKHPKISTSRKKEIFKNIFQGKIDDNLLSFLLVLIDKNRIIYLDEIITELEKIDLEKNNKIIAEVKTVILMDDVQKKTLISKLQGIYKKQIILREELDKSIIGGVFVKVGDDVIDGTVKSKLEEMKKIMLKGK